MYMKKLVMVGPDKPAMYMYMYDAGHPCYLSLSSAINATVPMLPLTPPQLAATGQDEEQIGEKKRKGAQEDKSKGGWGWGMGDEGREEKERKRAREGSEKGRYRTFINKLILV